MIHVLLVSGRTALFHESEPIQVTFKDPRQHSEWTELIGYAADLVDLNRGQPRKRKKSFSGKMPIPPRRFVRANYQGPWWHVAAARVVPDAITNPKEKRTL